MEVLLRIGAGHSWHGITDTYTVEAIKQDVAFLKATAQQTGLVSHMSTIVPRLPVAPNPPKAEDGNFSASARKK